jgi:hypothetical protein
MLSLATQQLQHCDPSHISCNIPCPPPLPTEQETRKIKEGGLPPEAEHAVLSQLLARETKLLQTIDRLKINANHENRAARVAGQLASMARPKRMELKDGRKVRVAGACGREKSGCKVLRGTRGLPTRVPCQPCCAVDVCGCSSGMECTYESRHSKGSG